MEVAQFYDPAEAYCAKGYLKSFGIDTVVQNENHLSVAPSLRIALGGFRLLAISDQKDDALAALRDVGSRQSKDCDITINQTDISQDGYRPRRKNWFWLPLILAMGVPFLPIYRHRSTLVWQFLLLILPFYVTALWGYWGWVGVLD